MSRITTNIDLAVATLQQGEIVAIPTETVYGLAANAENEQAIRKIYAMKKRPLNHPLIMHVLASWDLNQWTREIPEYARILIQHFWPGPLTLVLKSKRDKVNPLITGGQDSIALRCPKHPLAQKLLETLGFPLVAPSANPFGKISPTTAEHVQHSFKDEELLILDGGRCEVGIESTIVAAINPKGYEILRPGLIDERQINAVLSTTALNEKTAIRVSGQLKSHYQPEKPLYCFSNIQDLEQFIQTEKSAFVLSFKELTALNPEFYYCLPNSPKEAAFELYYQLRRADQSSASCIVIELPNEAEGWQGIRERLLKAAHQS